MNTGFAYGVDLGWMSQLEERGFYWSDSDGVKKDIIEIMKDKDIDSIRLRLFVNPPVEGFWNKSDTERCMLGFCDTESVLKVAKRVCEAGMRLMLDFHYSDLFADPQYQQTPLAWINHSEDELVRDVREYTIDTLNTFKTQGITPEWVQVGNEINPGMLLPMGDANTNMSGLVRVLNAGYDAVKEVFPNALVITHLANGAIKPWIEDWFDAFFEKGGKCDVIGLSHYPYWYKMLEGVTMTDLGDNMASYYERYKKPIMVVEVGEDEDDPEKSALLLTKTLDDLRKVPDNNGLGMFYWEPEVGKDVLPDKYPLGASRLIGEKEIRFTTALNAYKH